MDDQALLDLMHACFIKNQTESNERLSFEEFYLIVSKFYAKTEKWFAQFSKELIKYVHPYSISFIFIFFSSLF